MLDVMSGSFCDITDTIWAQTQRFTVKPQMFAAMVVKFSRNMRLECSVETGRLVTGDAASFSHTCEVGVA